MVRHTWKPGLDQGHVEKMLKLIEKQFGNDWDLRTLTQKVNQKCRDSAKDVALHAQITTLLHIDH